MSRQLWAAGERHRVELCSWSSQGSRNLKTSCPLFASEAQCSAVPLQGTGPELHAQIQSTNFSFS